MADIQRELYVALTIDRGHRGPMLIASAAGGMDIEEVAATRPQDIHTEPIEPVLGLMPYQTRRLAAKLELTAAQVRPGDPGIERPVSHLYRIGLRPGGNQSADYHRRRPGGGVRRQAGSRG